jgi:hypothetical protein
MSWPTDERLNTLRERVEEQEQELHVALEELQAWRGARSTCGAGSARSPGCGSAGRSSPASGSAHGHTQTGG